MTQPQMYDRMIEIKEIIKREFDVTLHDEKVLGSDYDERDFCYDIHQITTLWLWHPSQRLSERTVFDLHEEFMKPDVFFPQVVLDKIRRWLKEWIKVRYWQKEFAGMNKDEIFVVLVNQIDVLYIDPHCQIIGIIETPFGKREYIFIPEAGADTLAKFDMQRYEWKLRTFERFYAEICT